MENYRFFNFFDNTIFIFFNFFIKASADSNNIIFLTVGLMGSIASTIGTLLATKIFFLSNKSQEVTNKTLHEIIEEERKIMFLINSNKKLVEEIHFIKNENVLILEQIKNEQKDLKKILLK